MPCKIPLVDLTAQYTAIKPQIDRVLARVVERSQFVGGPILGDFESAFADYCGVEYAIGVGTGTAALHLALEAVGVGPGDEVIVPAHTFIATVEPIVLLGARPVFADIRADTYAIDPASVERCLGESTKAVIPVHLYGQIADMEGIYQMIAGTGRDIAVIEDAAQAHGARQNGKRAGGLADAACFSFYPGKNLGAYGDGGAVTTSDEALAHRIRMLRDHGRVDKYRHDMIGHNTRLDTLQAAVLHTKLEHLDEWNARRRSRAAWYDRHLAGLPGVTVPKVAAARGDTAARGDRAGNESVYHLYVIEVDDREGLREHLAADGIASGVHYPIPLHQQPALRTVDFGADDLAVTERAASRILSLPMYAELTDEQAARVVESVRSFQTGDVVSRQVSSTTS